MKLNEFKLMKGDDDEDLDDEDDKDEETDEEW